jgi:SprT protein
MEISAIRSKLSPFLPEETLDWVADFLTTHKVELAIKRPRSSKLGDYRSPFKNKGHRISINNDLNKFSFLITLTHEFAHLLTWNEYGNKVPPHGTEWKAFFKTLIYPLIEKSIFPEDINAALSQYISNPSASSCTDANLSYSLAKYDENEGRFLSELEYNDVFRLPNGLVLVKGEKLRKYYKCRSYRGIKQYRVNEMARVEKVK